MIARLKRFDRYLGNLERARQNFREDYGFSHVDKERVDREIVKYLERANDNLDQFKVTIPVELVIALTLREGFGREPHRTKRPALDQRKLESAIRNAWTLIRKYSSQGISKGEARNRAIREAASDEHISESVLRNEMGRSEYSHLKSMGPTHKM